MARKKVRTAADIVFDITVNEMQHTTLDEYAYIHFGFDADRNNVISGNHPGNEPTTQGEPGTDWSITVYPNGTHTATGDVPARILAQL